MCDDELAELDFDLEALPGFEAGVFEPTAGELEPRHERRGRPSARRVGSPAGRLLNRDAARGVSVVKCFKIGVSHIDFWCELMVVSGPYGLAPMRPALRLRRWKG